MVVVRWGIQANPDHGDPNLDLEQIQIAVHVMCKESADHITDSAGTEQWSWSWSHLSWRSRAVGCRKSDGFHGLHGFINFLPGAIQD